MGQNPVNTPPVAAQVGMLISHPREAQVDLAPALGLLWPNCHTQFLGQNWMHSFMCVWIKFHT
jgi:hypothetical protein